MEIWKGGAAKFTYQWSLEELGGDRRYGERLRPMPTHSPNNLPRCSLTSRREVSLAFAISLAN